MILVRYVLKELIAPFLASLFGITFLFVVDFLVKILDNVLSKGLPASTVLEIFVLNLAWMLSLSIPMAVLATEKEPLKFTTYGFKMFSLNPQTYLYSSLFISNISF